MSLVVDSNGKRSLCDFFLPTGTSNAVLDRIVPRIGNSCSPFCRPTKGDCTTDAPPPKQRDTIGAAFPNMCTKSLTHDVTHSLLLSFIIIVLP